MLPMLPTLNVNLERRNFDPWRGTDVNEVHVRSTPRPMSTEHRDRSIELLPPFESRHYSHKGQGFVALK